ncbi:hypothetical protein DLE60_20445 [Micromonospora globispora]|uniref:Glycosyltransferase n=1 Tax=Micromonospora globispora TaxID=1450148 RepID=A0A317JWH4_9ACTN|nr:hypothetical protein [Micromonospora globispora]PWU44324.1 hypothetical protein DLJ46_26560 [Micromonospora globispora]PWU58692.1 hypothetical protein DLE60_20445 [Micromonospora globispora]RQX02714.1 hypothetical protein DKL51_04560 [Micromonospora globispora]
MHVLFLSVGGTRRRAVVEESAQVLADGGTATVVVDRAGPWSKETFATGVTVVELAGLEQRQPALRFEQAVLYKAPRKVLRTVGRGPLRRFAKRAEKSYERRVASRVHRALLRMRGDVRPRLVESLIRRGAGVDVVVVTDPLAMPYAARLVTGAAQASKPSVCFSYDYAGDTPKRQLRSMSDAVQGDNS